MVYIEPMELQTQIDELKTSSKRQKLAIIALAGVIVAGVGIAAIQPAGDATFGTITCKDWRIVDKDGKQRIDAGTNADGDASVTWLDKDGKMRINATTLADGNASVQWWDKDEKLRIAAVTLADGQASVQWRDKDGKVRMAAVTRADGTVVLPTSDLKPKK